MTGSADEAVGALLAGNLAFDPDVHCDHHGHHEEGNHYEKGHHCNEEKHGCGGHSYNG